MKAHSSDPTNPFNTTQRRKTKINQHKKLAKMLQTNKSCLSRSSRGWVERSGKRGPYFIAAGKYLAQSNTFDDLEVVLVPEGKKYLGLYWASEAWKIYEKFDVAKM